jgi:hypothetical protein
MAKPMTADDLLPLIATLAPRERVRLMRLITEQRGDEAAIYAAVPPRNDEFSADEEPLAWEAEGWESQD